MKRNIDRLLRDWRLFVAGYRQTVESDERSQFDKSKTLSLSMLLTALSLRHLEKTSDGAAQTRTSPVKYSTADKELLLQRASQLHLVATKLLPSELPYQLAEPKSAQHELLLDLLEQPSFEQIDSLVDDNFIFGYTYQYWRSEDRKRAQFDIQTANKEFDKDGLTAFTQIYTPDWVVDFLLANTLVPRLPAQIVPSARLAPYMVLNRRTEQSIQLQDIRILDPACGTGHFLLRAFDELLAAYQLLGYTVEQAVDLIISCQIVGADIDSLALSILAFAYSTKLARLGLSSPPTARLVMPRNDERDLIGSLERDWSGEHPLKLDYDIVLTNPPYIGRKLISRELAARLKTLYPGMHHDLNSAFIKRCLELLKPGGSLGVITQNSIMFLPSHGNLRSTILNEYTLMTAVEAGPGVFPLQGGEKVDSAMLVVDRPDSTDVLSTAAVEYPPSGSIFMDLRESSDKVIDLISAAADHKSHFGKQIAGDSAFKLVPFAVLRRYHKCAFNYQIPSAVALLLQDAEPLSTLTDIRQGLATTDNKRFVKLIWEVNAEEIGKRWFPYVKGAGSQRWFSPVRHVVNWEDNGSSIKKNVKEKYPYLRGKTNWVVKNESHYFRQGLCFSFVNTKSLAVRFLPAGCIFDVAASAIFSNSGDEAFLLGYLNSSFIGALSSALNPTVNHQVGDVKRLPVIDLSNDEKYKIRSIANECIVLKQQYCRLTNPSARLHATGSTRRLEPWREVIRDSGYKSEEGESVIESLMVFKKALSTISAKLSFLKQELDSTILYGVARSRSWTASTVAEVEKWIGVDSTNDGETNTTEEVPLYLLDNLLSDFLFSSLVTDSRNAIVEHQTLVSTIESVYSQAELQLLCDGIGMNCIQYVSNQFPRRFHRYFLGVLPWEMKTESNNKLILQFNSSC